MKFKSYFLMQTTAATLTVAVSFSAVADGRIRTEVYSENRVYPIYAEIGKAAMKQMSALAMQTLWWGLGIPKHGHTRHAVTMSFSSQNPPTLLPI